MFRPVTLYHIETLRLVQGEDVLEIIGWAACRFDPITEIFFKIDNGPLLSGQYGFSKPDVPKTHDGFSESCGFQGLVPTTGKRSARFRLIGGLKSGARATLATGRLELGSNGAATFAPERLHPLERLTQRIWQESKPFIPLGVAAAVRQSARRILRRIAPTWLVPSYHPDSWGHSPSEWQMTFLLDGGETSELASQVGRSLACRDNEVLPFDSGKATGGLSPSQAAAKESLSRRKVTLVFDSSRLSGLRRDRPGSPFIICLDAPSDDKLSRACRRAAQLDQPWRCLAIGDGNAPKLAGADSRIAWVDIEAIEQIHRPAHIARRVEELAVDLLEPTDAALALNDATRSKAVVVRRVTPQDGHLPPTESLSIVIPTYNGGPAFEETLNSLRAQRRYSDSALIVVDSGSTDGTVALAKEYGARIFEVDNADFNHGTTRDLGVSKVATPFVALLVQDALLLDSECLCTMMRHFRHSNVAGVFTSPMPRREHDVLGRGESKLHRVELGPLAKHVCIGGQSAFDTLDYRQRLRLCRFDSCCSVLRRDVWTDVPFGPHEFGEDIAWSKKVQLAGYTIAFDPFARIVHSHDRPPAYYRSRHLIDAVSTSKILETCPTNLRGVSWRHVIRSREALIRLKERLQIDLRGRCLTDAEGERLTVWQLRASLRHAHAELIPSGPRIHGKLELFLYHLLTFVGLLVNDLPDATMWPIGDADVLVEKAAAAIEGQLLGHVAAYLMAGQKPLPGELLDELERASVGV